MDNRQTVIGIFDNPTQARKAVEQLHTDGFNKDIVDVSAHGRDIKDTDHEKTDTFFTNLLGRDTNVTNYREAARNGTVVTVHTDEMKNAERAAAILDKFGALNVADRDHTARPTGAATGATDTGRTDKDRSIPVIEEKMEIGKREVTTGGVNVHSRIVEKPIEETMRLREEHVHVDRKTVDRPASKADFNTFKEGDTRITEHAEVPVVKKEARVVEEVRLSKDTEQHKETVRDTVRRTEVDVDKIDPDKDRNRRL